MCSHTSSREDWHVLFIELTYHDPGWDFAIEDLQSHFHLAGFGCHGNKTACLPRVDASRVLPSSLQEDIASYLPMFPLVKSLDGSSIFETICLERSIARSNTSNTRKAHLFGGLLIRHHPPLLVKKLR